MKYLILFPISSFFVLIGCTRSGEFPIKIKDQQQITITRSDGRYVCTDKNQNNRVVANRENAEVWENFSVKILGKNKFALRAFNFSYIKYIPSENGLLAADGEIDVRASFTLTKVDSGNYVLSNNEDKY